MAYAYADLQAAEWHVREGTQRIAKYRLLLDQSKEAGAPTGRSEAVLKAMIDMQRTFEDHAREIREELGRVVICGIPNPLDR